MVYFDNAATTFPKPESVYEAMDFAQRNLSFNAGRGSYRESRDCRRVLDEAREEIASLCGAEGKDVALLSSATEALNLIIAGLDLTETSNAYISPFEHNAIVRPLFNLERSRGIKIHILPFDKKTWEPDTAKIQNMFALNKPTAVFCSQISNVTGLLLDYSQVFSLAKKHDAITVLDAAQGFGIEPIKKNNVDFIVFAGHKSLYGPFGIGGFINLGSKELSVVKSGGTGSDTLNHFMPDAGHERYESGSSNVPAAYAISAGIKWLRSTQIRKRETELTEHLIKSLSQLHKVTVFLPAEKAKVLGIVSLAVDGYSADEVGDILGDEFGFCVRMGYHCSPFVHDFIGSSTTGGTVRISLGYFNSSEEIDALVSALATL